VVLAGNFAGAATGRDSRRPVGEWSRLGVRAVGGRPLASPDTMAALLIPDGPAGDAFLVYTNFGAIRRYNPSDYYALVVGLLGDTVTA
jgi:membrane-bound lytic murein transglycosylase B